MASCSTFNPITTPVPNFECLSMYKCLDHRAHSLTHALTHALTLPLTHSLIWRIFVPTKAEDLAAAKERQTAGMAEEDKPCTMKEGLKKGFLEHLQVGFVVVIIIFFNASLHSILSVCVLQIVTSTIIPHPNTPDHFSECTHTMGRRLLQPFWGFQHGALSE